RLFQSPGGEGGRFPLESGSEVVRAVFEDAFEIAQGKMAFRDAVVVKKHLLKDAQRALFQRVARLRLENESPAISLGKAVRRRRRGQGLQVHIRSSVTRGREDEKAGCAAPATSRASAGNAAGAAAGAASGPLSDEGETPVEDREGHPAA